MRIPEVPAVLPEALKSSPQATSTACGYLVLYLRLAAAVFGAPQLHEPGFLGATSSVWQPATFWNSEPCSQRLHLQNEPPQFTSWTAQASQALDSQQMSRCASPSWGLCPLLLATLIYVCGDLA
jgi:hypothetical protein